MRTWTITLECVVRGPARDVARWWSAPERSSEFRADLEARASDLVWREEVTGSEHRTTAAWTAPSGIRVELLLSAPPLELSGEGWVRHRWIRQRRFLPDGRQDVFESRTVHTFVEVAPGVTSVRYRHSWTRTGGPWWERFVPPVAQKAGERKVLRDLAGRCQADLMGPAEQPPPGRMGVETDRPAGLE